MPIVVHQLPRVAIQRVLVPVLVTWNVTVCVIGAVSAHVPPCVLRGVAASTCADGTCRHNAWLEVAL